MLVTTLIALTAAAQFPGGNISDLAKSIAEETKQNVVFQAGAGENAPAFQYDPSDLNALAKQVLDATGFKRAPGAEHVFHHGRLGTWLFSVRSLNRAFNDEAWRNGGPWPSGAMTDGKVTLHSASGQSVSVESIPRDLLAKPLEMHWIFERSAIKAWVTDQPALDFMNFVAKAVGGKVLQRTDRFVMDIDPGEIQRRGVATLVEVKKSPSYAQMSPVDKGRIELSRSVLASLQTAQLNALLATPQGRLRFEIGPGTRPAVQTYLQLLIQQQGRTEDLDPTSSQIQIQAEQVTQERGGGRRGDQRDQRDQRNLGLVLRRADPRLIGFTTIDARFNVQVELLTLDNFGRPGRLVQLP